MKTLDAYITAVIDHKFAILELWKKLLSGVDSKKIQDIQQSYRFLPKVDAIEKSSLVKSNSNEPYQ